MDTDRHIVLATADQEAVARQFERYGLMAAPVVDKNERLVGVVTVDDVVEVIEQEVEEDAKLLAGVGDERLSDSVREIAPPRFSWLFVNLFTAILASAVISLFDATIESMVALAVLMPIVASMGGNAGTQTMTVAVRALATKELNPANIVRVVLRETAVGLINGFAFALIMALVVFAWFGTEQLGLVIGAAMIVNMLAAALAGIFIPLALDRMGFDPAVASTVFVTTVTDVVGFFSFLGLATLVAQVRTGMSVESNVNIRPLQAVRPRGVGSAVPRLHQLLRGEGAGRRHRRRLAAAAEAGGRLARPRRRRRQATGRSVLRTRCSTARRGRRRRTAIWRISTSIATCATTARAAR